VPIDAGSRSDCETMTPPRPPGVVKTTELAAHRLSVPCGEGQRSKFPWIVTLPDSESAVRFGAKACRPAP
jgi:hypothetical protein